ncbi:hypothetical protein [Actinomadura rupiterrae]|uniref:hypothetical protein n=1 Tax=Actinomadura rupiterrae TaxID=559627 RepID=UPI0020A58190|nr:hypothetical protein [Actinomadura rupiterrae]MCP2337263.1 hypothetical protein [Actinomadura rupiterrae]
MAGTPGDEYPPSRAPEDGDLWVGGRGPRRRRPKREHPAVWWTGFAVLALLAWLAGSWRLALLVLAAWCLYEFLLIPTVCRVMTEQGYPCREPVRGRPFACGRDHQAYKNEGIMRLLGVRRPARDTAPRNAPGRDDRVLVHSRAARSRLAQADQVCLSLAGAGTVIALAGMIYGFGA